MPRQDLVSWSCAISMYAIRNTPPPSSWPSGRPLTARRSTSSCSPAHKGLRSAQGGRESLTASQRCLSEIKIIWYGRGWIMDPVATNFLHYRLFHAQLRRSEEFS